MMRRAAIGVLGALLAVPAAAQEVPTLVVSDPSIDIRVDGQLYRDAWSLTWADEPDRTGIEVDGAAPKEMCLVSRDRSACVAIARGETRQLAARYDGKTYRIAITGTGPEARFDAAYRAENAGKVRIGIPEAYELVNIAIALTPYASAHPGLIARGSDYYRDVIAHFGRLRGHPFVLALDHQMTIQPASYVDLKMNGNAFVVDQAGHIAPSPIYDRIGSSMNFLRPYFDEMRAFAAASDFDAFYTAHQPFYDSQVSYVRNDIDVDAMIGWLGRNFPSVEPYDTISIVFSPLVGYNQSMTTISDGDFRELQPHVNFPYPDTIDQNVSDAARPFVAGEILFTELNHGFINPTAKPFADRIAAALSPRADWVRADASADAYPSAQDVFNEMMNWALIDCFALDAAPAADHAAIQQRTRKIMVGRGFTRFPEFDRYLSALYRDRAPGTSLEVLYPQIIGWFEAHAN